jgi:2-(1,2-epoxy-1,2-dihydrophenyl)acetyl-CoA isomerase
VSAPEVAGEGEWTVPRKLIADAVLWVRERRPSPRAGREHGRRRCRHSRIVAIFPLRVDNSNRRSFDFLEGVHVADEDPQVLAAVEGAVLSLTLNRPEKLNAINYAMIAGLLEELDRARDNDRIRAVVLGGSGRALSAGDDVSGMGVPPYPVPPGAHPVGHMQQRLMRMWFWYPKPTIAAVHGRCHGIAEDLALSADFRLVADDVVFGDLRVRRAIPVGSGGTWLLPRLIGLPRATSIMLTGGTIGAGEMAEFGLAHEVVPVDKFETHVAEFAAALAAGPTKAIGIMKRELRHNLTVGFDEGLDFELSLLDEPVEDRAEGVRSFVEGRTPVYTGR